MAEDGSESLNEIKAFLDMEELTKDTWKKSIKDVYLYPDKRLSGSLQIFHKSKEKQKRVVLINIFS